jgi:hypothetical protein
MELTFDAMLSITNRKTSTIHEHLGFSLREAQSWNRGRDLHVKITVIILE